MLNAPRCRLYVHALLCTQGCTTPAAWTTVFKVEIVGRVSPTAISSTARLEQACRVGSASYDVRFQTCRCRLIDRSHAASQCINLAGDARHALGRTSSRHKAVA
ncbi:hypothetical protein EVAR_30123_1 [Eumeta japonica]|uniref:Uncharacterized protein n=1 Tax=Eumeta variegata TaxID=151549 RepID=A0A4C1WJX6_EUMVA|nr:hypothetical protein EVAR_30123_1 [Eumeta japonica]